MERGDRVLHFDLRELLRDHPCDGPEARAFAEGYGLDGAPRVLREAESLLLPCSFDLVRRARDRAPDRPVEERHDLLGLIGRIARSAEASAGRAC